MTFIDYFNRKFRPIINTHVSINYRNAPKEEFDNGLGILYGVDLESDQYAGYIYFWDKGYFDFSVIRLADNEVLIPITVLGMADFKSDAIIEKVVNYFI